jgi:hypothetical protein
MTTVSSKFELSNLAIADERDLKNFQLKIIVTDLVSKLRCSEALNVKIKAISSNYHSKKGAMICKKAAYMNKDSDYLTFRWWLELNKHIGYSNIFISNQSIENHASFHELFNQNKDFIEVSTLKCIPNVKLTLNSR